MRLLCMAYCASPHELRLLPGTLTLRLLCGSSCAAPLELHLLHFGLALRLIRCAFCAALLALRLLTQNLLRPPANMKVLLRASFLAVRGAHTEQALSW